MNILRITLFDLHRVAKDKLAVLWLLVLPLILTFAMGNVFSSSGPHTAWIHVFNHDQSPLSHLFVDQLEDEGFFIDKKPPEEEKNLKTWMNCGVIIPATFSHDIMNREPVRITYVKGNGNPEQILETQSQLVHALVRFTKGLIKADLNVDNWTDESHAKLKETLDQPSLLTVARKSVTSLKPPPSGINRTLPSYLIMFVLMMTVMYGGITMVNDRQYGQFTRLAAAPVYFIEIFIGKTISRILQGSLQSFIILFAGAYLFSIPLGDHPMLLVPVIVAFASFCGCLSIFVGMVCTTEQQVTNIGIFFAMFLTALGGCWWPIEVVPDVFKIIAMSLPTYWGLHAIQNVLYFGKTFEPLWVEVPILLAFALLFVLLTLPFAKRYHI
ncbi:MAG: ABC transporter permease [Candidatus Omnitrophota bacterium]|jgi:ABC-type multidrug transport system permease subunit|nr:MAG: ABC transporter permease [Candidatus Omnitrophota bacterium]